MLRIPFSRPWAVAPSVFHNTAVSCCIWGWGACFVPLAPISWKGPQGQDCVCLSPLCTLAPLYPSTEPGLTVIAWGQTESEKSESI